MVDTYTISEDYELPSKGLIYEKQINPNVTLTPMLTSDEMKRLSPTNTPYKVLSEIIETRMLNKLGMSVYDLCIADYEFLLHKIRTITYGPEYKMVIGCPHCNETYETAISLDDLEVVEYDKDTVEPLFTITLPVSQKIIHLNYQTPRMLDNIELKIKEWKKRNKAITLDPTPLIRLKEFIDLVDGNKLSDTALETFIMNLPAKDKLYIEQRIDKINSSFGINPLIQVECNKCGGEVLTFFRFGPEFFRPTID